MRSFSIVAILALASSVLAVPHVARDDSSCTAEICQGPVDLSIEAVVVPSVTVPTKRLTNAERFARGLTPAAPRRRLHRGTPVARDYPSSTPVVTKRGVIEITRTDTNESLGYLSKNSFSQAQYRYQDLSNAMTINFEAPEGALTVSSVNFNSEDSDIATPTLVGLVQGRDDTDASIAPGSFQYGYVAATAQTPAGSPPSDTTANSYSTVTSRVRSVESAVWSVDLTTGAITVQWINPDNSTPVTQLFTQGTALYFGGDSAAFLARYPSPVTNITLKFVSL